MATTKTCTDARGTVKSVLNGVTPAPATDSRRTKHKSSFEHHFAQVFDARGVDSDAPKPPEWLKNTTDSQCALKDNADRSNFFRTVPSGVNRTLRTGLPQSQSTKLTCFTFFSIVGRLLARAPPKMLGMYFPDKIDDF